MFNTEQGLKGVGEKGPEAVTPISKLQEYVATAVGNSNDVLEEKMDTLINVLLKYFPMVAERELVLDSGAMVGALAYKMDRTLGDISKKKNRGR